MSTLVTSYAALVGLVVGSFLNVVVYRLPRGASLVRPGSACPTCRTPVRPRDNVPVLSWLLLRGRCRGCATPISARYPLVEASTAALMALVVLVLWGDPTRVVLGVVLVAFLVPITLIDLEHRLIPNRLTVPAAVLAVVLGLALDPGGEPERLLAGVGAFAFFLLAAVARPGGMGMGDVKLAGVLGLFLGRAALPAIAVALLAGVVVGAVIIARQGVAARKATVPFGPLLALGGLVGVLAGDELIDGYLDLVA